MGKDSDWSIVLHGGAGVAEHKEMPPEREAGFRAGMAAGLAAGVAVLEAGGTALDAVQAAVEVLEVAEVDVEAAVAVDVTVVVVPDVADRVEVAFVCTIVAPPCGATTAVRRNCSRPSRIVTFTRSARTWIPASGGRAAEPSTVLACSAVVNQLGPCEA